MRESGGSVGEPVQSVTLPDILNVIPAKTYILKTDIQGYECRVLSDLSLYSQQYFIPFIFMEFDSDSPTCSGAVDVLMGHGYSALLKVQVMYKV